MRAPADVGAVVAALGGTAGADPLDLLAAHADDVVGRGPLTWVRGLGIAPELWSRTS